MILDFDFETFCELDLRKVGADVYTRHPSCEVVLLAYSIDNGPVKQWDRFEGIPYFPQDFMEALMEQDRLLWAHNAAFERQVLRNVERIKVPISRWRDTMILAHSCSFPGSLEKLGPILGMGEDKKKLSRGKALLRRFCKPRKPTKNKPWTRETPETSPDEWTEFREYNRQDVVAQQEVRRRLKRFMPSMKWWRFWHLDQVINQRGMPVNTKMVQNAIWIYEDEVARLRAELIEITGLANPNSGAQFLPWAKHHGYVFDDLRKGHVARGLAAAREAMGADGVSPEAYARSRALVAALERRAVISQTSPKKYYALERATAEDGRLRNTFQFFGAARTGRFAGRIFQPQNLPRPAGEYERAMPALARAVEILDVESLRATFGDPITALKSAIRPVVQAPEGYVFSDCDLSAIENRGIGWITGDSQILRVFEQGRDPYLDFGSRMFHRTYEDVVAEYRAGKGGLRKVSKPGVLGCIAAGTPVLTGRGWVPIERVKASDVVYDGAKFRRCGGAAYRGRKKVIEAAGVMMTPDHKVLVGEGKWLRADNMRKNHMRQALVLAHGRLSSFLGSRLVPVRCMSLSARQGTGGGSGGRGLTGASRAGNAPGMNSGSFLGVLIRHGKFWPIGFTLSGRDVIRCEGIADMGFGGSGAGSVMSVTSFGMLFAISGLLTGIRGKLIGRITQGITRRGTFASCLGRRSARTWRRIEKFCIWAGRGVRQSFIAVSRLNIGIQAQWRGRFVRVNPPKKLLRNRSIAEAHTYDILDVEETQRFVVMGACGPLIAHNCGYGLGEGQVIENEQTGELEATGLLGYAWNMGIKLTPEESALSVQTFRHSYRDVVKFWARIVQAVKQVIRTGRPARLRWFTVDLEGPFLRISLPSGRYLHYYKPLIQMKTTPWGERRPTFTYMGMSDRAHWARTKTHGGKLLENITQAVALDLLLHGMLNAHRRGLDIRLHVHDQIVVQSPEDRAEEELKVLRECMIDAPKWARGFPLDAAGFLSPVFTKD